MNEREYLKRKNWICRYVGCNANLYEHHQCFSPITKYCYQCATIIKKFNDHKLKEEYKKQKREKNKKRCRFCGRITTNTYCSVDCRKKYWYKKKNQKRMLAQKRHRLYAHCPMCGIKLKGHLLKQYCSRTCQTRRYNKIRSLRRLGYKV